MVEQDYIMRLLHETVRSMIKLIFGTEEEQPEKVISDEKVLAGYQQYIVLAEEGKINEAENLLYRERDTENQEYLKAALLFYEYINTFTDARLAECSYSREEIKDGIDDALQDFGYNGFAGIDMIEELFARE